MQSLLSGLPYQWPMPIKIFDLQNWSAMIGINQIGINAAIFISIDRHWALIKGVLHSSVGSPLQGWIHHSCMDNVSLVTTKIFLGCFIPGPVDPITSLHRKHAHFFAGKLYFHIRIVFILMMNNNGLLWINMSNRTKMINSWTLSNEVSLNH